MTEQNGAERSQQKTSNWFSEWKKEQAAMTEALAAATRSLEEAQKVVDDYLKDLK